VNVVPADFIGPATARPDLTLFLDDTPRQQLINGEFAPSRLPAFPWEPLHDSQELAQGD
jgi:hypothetical protein